jgi:hypothetical protein
MGEGGGGSEGGRKLIENYELSIENSDRLFCTYPQFSIALR